MPIYDYCAYMAWKHLPTHPERHYFVAPEITLPPVPGHDSYTVSERAMGTETARTFVADAQARAVAEADFVRSAAEAARDDASRVAQ